MKRYLILGVFAASAAAPAAITAVAPHAAPKMMELPQAKQASAPLRRLSDAERAELRRQLRDFNRDYTSKHR
jgi:hypothetical protein